MKLPQFRIRHLLILMAFVGVLVAWWVDRTNLAHQLEAIGGGSSSHHEEEPGEM